MLPSGMKIWVGVNPVNMKLSFDGLAVKVKQMIEAAEFEGQLFIFRNRQGDKVKILYWDRNGFALWYKRLERGVFRFPRIQGEEEQVYRLTVSELSLLLEGIDLTEKTRLRNVKAREVS